MPPSRQVLRALELPLAKDTWMSSLDLNMVSTRFMTLESISVKVKIKWWMGLLHLHFNHVQYIIYLGNRQISNQEKSKLDYERK